MGIWDDTFTGSDGDPPDSAKWEVISNTNDAAAILSNRLMVNYNVAPYAPDETTVDIRGKYLLEGDFDIQIDLYRLYIQTTGSYTYLGLKVITEDESEFAHVGYYGGAGAYGVFAGDSDQSGNPYFTSNVFTTSDGNQLRITRSSGVVTAYHWDVSNSAWEGDFNDSAGWTLKTISGDVRVCLFAYCVATKRFYGGFDNFLINSGTATALPESGINAEEFGIESVVDGYNQSGQTPQGFGIQSAIDAESDYIFNNFKIGFNSSIDTSGNILAASASGGVGLKSDVICYLATEQFVLNVGFKGTIDAVYQTKHNAENFGLNSLIASNREFLRDSEEQVGMNAFLDAYNFTTWAAANLKTARKVYKLTLTGGQDGVADIEIPFSSFVARKRSDSPTYLSAVIRKYDYAAQIAARSNGDIVVNAVYLVGGVESLRQEVVRAPLDTISIDEGPRSRSITLSGYATVTYHQRSVTLSGAIYKRFSAGKHQYRFSDIDIFLNPKDELTVGDDTFEVGSLTYYVSGNTRQMDVFQVEQ